MEMYGLIILGLYVTMMPKELSHLVFASIGAGAYLFFLTMQPNIDLLNFKKASPDEKECVQKGTANSSASPNESPCESRKTSPSASPNESPKLFPQAANPNLGLRLISKPIETTMAYIDDDFDLDQGREHMTKKVISQANAGAQKPMKGVCCPRFQQRLSDDNIKHQATKLSQLDKEKQANFEEVRHLLAEHLAETEKPKKSTLSASAPVWTGAIPASTPLSTAAAPYFYSGNQLIATNMAPNQPIVTNMDAMQNFQPICLNDNVFTAAMPTSFPMTAIKPPTPSPGLLPEGTSDDACWDWVSCGYCQRGARCRWEHPPHLCAFLLGGQPEVQCGNGNFVQPGWQPEYVETVFADPSIISNGGGIPMDSFY